MILRLSRYISWRAEENQNVTFMTTMFTLAYTSGVKGAAAFKSIPGARWLFWVMASLQLGQRTDFIKLFGQPGHHQAAAHKHKLYTIQPLLAGELFLQWCIFSL